jgi:hypothetical protein
MTTPKAKTFSGLVIPQSIPHGGHMKTKLAGFVFLLLLTTPIQSKASTNPEALGRNVLSERPAEAGRAIAELRAMGPAGLNALFLLYRDQINRHVADPAAPLTPEWLRLSAALDAVSQQRNSYLSGLYWYTDLSQAEAAARASGKPILSLRLLGNLNEEFSCANSRFFRTVLYSNTAVSQTLRDRFILHWQSVRPAPHITIDFGDGRKLERTITGNSIHYILDAQGRPIDALPGLYGPAAFLRALGQIENSYLDLSRAGEDQRAQKLAVYHRQRLNAINVLWAADTQLIGGKLPRGLTVVKNTDGTPAAIEVASLAMTKAVTEVSILRSMTAGSEALGAMTDEAAWNRLASLHLADALLDARSIALIRRQNQSVLGSDATVQPDKVLNKMLRKLQLNIALDTVRNEYLLHTKLHGWLITDPKRNDVEALNEKVYAELFLTPKADPWLGLFAADVYTGLENGGVVR